MSAALLQIKADDSGAAVKVPPLVQVARPIPTHPPCLLWSTATQCLKTVGLGQS